MLRRLSMPKPDSQGSVDLLVLGIVSRRPGLYVRRRPPRR
jgi:hypothetical protein